MQPAKPSSSLLPNVTSDWQPLCERHAKPIGRPRLWQIICFRSQPAQRGIRNAARNDPGGNFCRVVYRSLTIPAQATRYSRTDPFRLGNNCHAHLWAKWNRTGGGSFSVSEQDVPRNSTSTTSLRAISTVDALIALQGVEDPTERKKRAVAKGRNALDVLDKLKLGLLDGGLDQSILSRLRVVSEGLTETSGDAGLDRVLSEIDLRVAVELAKAGVR